MSRKNRSDDAGFTLIEALVALAIVAAVLSSIGAAIAATVRGTRAIDERLSLASTAEAVLTALPSRALLKPGRRNGMTGGHRWRIDVSPMPTAVAGDGPPPRWIPLAVDIRLQRPGGGIVQMKTVRLVQRSGP